MPLHEKMALFRSIDEDGSGQIDRYEFTHHLKGTDNMDFRKWMAVRGGCGSCGDGRRCVSGAVVRHRY